MQEWCAQAQAGVRPCRSGVRRLKQECVHAGVVCAGTSRSAPMQEWCVQAQAGVRPCRSGVRRLKQECVHAGVVCADLLPLRAAPGMPCTHTHTHTHTRQHAQPGVFLPAHEWYGLGPCRTLARRENSSPGSTTRSLVRAKYCRWAAMNWMQSATRPSICTHAWAGMLECAHMHTHTHSHVHSYTHAHTHPSTRKHTGTLV